MRTLTVTFELTEEEFSLLKIIDRSAYPEIPIGSIPTIVKLIDMCLVVDNEDGLYSTTRLGDKFLANNNY